VRTTFRDLEKRLSRIEQRVHPTVPCNCRMVTHFHNADCLAAILDKTPRQCPVHGFREMGFFWQTSDPYPINDGDNQFCPCPQHPWRSFQLSPEPATKQRSSTAMQAWQDMPRAAPRNFEENRGRTNALSEGYWKQKDEWVRTTGRQVPSLEELRKLQAKSYHQRGQK